MRKWMKRFMAAATLSLAGCSGGSDGTPECADISGGIRAYEQKGQPCDTASNPLPRFDTSQCERAITGCSEAEKQALATFANCLRAMPACTASTRPEFNEALEDCSLPVDTSIGAACGEVLGLD